ncbi:MAG: hypothetical protein COB67_13670 [SAR324 cluster bacterium]|uniref:Bestrophin n=1 Tax=SAR324 cluster bacterium TaxID=2024889 RepID=A0A2A4SKU1_9DELT|nr:MAG: hypothetical protein COB67_13670 [SAR324 cluster bacterium]
MGHSIRNFVSILNFKTMIIISMGLGATWLCQYWQLFAELPTSLIGIAVVFPIVFSINAAYQRREVALNHLSSFKSCSTALLFLLRDQPKEDSRELAENFRDLTLALFVKLKDYLEANQENKREFMDIHSHFNQISLIIGQLKFKGLTGGEISRAGLYFHSMMADFEGLRNIYLYRTPLALRAYTQIFLQAFPILFSPYFAYIADQSYPAAGYIVAALYSLVTSCLDNIQEELENPFDGIGMDDINLDLIREYKPILKRVLPDKIPAQKKDA